MTENNIISRLHLHCKTMTEEESFAIMDFLDELKQYRAIGTVEELKTAMKYVSLAKKHGTVGKAIDACAEYESIGTIEEFKALKEKNEPKKPIDLSTVKDGDSYYYIGRCPRCKDLVSEDDIVCEECHQVLDWS